MKITQTHSHFNGLEFLIIRKPRLWEEIQYVISEIECSTIGHLIKDGSVEEYRYDGFEVQKCFSKSLTNLQWVDAHSINSNTFDEDEQKKGKVSAGHVPIFIYNQTNFVKERVAIEVQFGKYAFVADDLFVKHLAFYVKDQIDVGIEILPMKSLQSQMSSGPSYFEGELYNVIRQGRGVPSVPLVVIGVEP